jgi:predicted nucleotidyltransferase
MRLKTMSDDAIQRKRDEYALALDSALEKIVTQLRQIPEVERVILFGSYSTGQRDLFTDIDLLVVMDSELDFVQRTAELYARIHTNVDMDLLVYTPGEMMKNRESGFLRRVLATGKVIYEKKSA